MGLFELQEQYFYLPNLRVKSKIDFSSTGYHLPISMFQYSIVNSSLFERILVVPISSALISEFFRPRLIRGTGNSESPNSMLNFFIVQICLD